MYQATIYFTAELDNYERGVTGNIVNEWQDTLTASTKKELKEKILSVTYTSNWEDVDDEQLNEYEDATEYSTSYMTNADNDGEATKSELEQFKAGTLDLYVIECHILVSQTVQTKATLA